MDRSEELGQKRLARILGLRRGGPEPAQTRAGQPLRPLTVPNLVGYFRLGLTAAFLLLSLSSSDGRVAAATIFFAVAAWADYFDGMLARLTGQYSRLGALMDPLVDRLLVVAGAVVTWQFELLPRWALVVVGARELFMLGTVGFALHRGLDLEINWIGRVAVWPTMSAIALALITHAGWPAHTLLYAGIAGSIAATLLYLRDGIQNLTESHKRGID